MNKLEALAALRRGLRIRHTSFTFTEWMERDGNAYVFEDGCICYPDEFWHWRTEECWDTGWSIVD